MVHSKMPADVIYKASFNILHTKPAFRNLTWTQFDYAVRELASHLKQTSSARPYSGNRTKEFYNALYREARAYGNPKKNKLVSSVLAGVGVLVALTSVFAIKTAR